MTVVPVGVSSVVIGAEIATARPWAERHGWVLEAREEDLLLDVRLKHPADQGLLLLRGRFDGYRALPPLWLFLDPTTEQMTPSSWPSAGPVPGGGSIFHSFGVICAHFSRTAYKEYAASAPHGNWSLTGWAGVTDGPHAETIAEMLAVIELHLHASPGRMT